MKEFTSDMVNAVINGDLLKVKEFFKESDDLLTCNEEYETPIYLAVKNGRLNILEYLLDLAGSIDFVGIREMTPLQMACVLSKLDVAEWLLEKGANQDFGDTPATPIFIAFEMADENVKCDLVKLLLKYGADHEKGSVISMCFAWGDIEIVKILIERGLDLYKQNHIINGTVKDIPYRYFSPLGVAIWACNKDVIRYLMDLGIDFKDYKKLCFECFFTACSTGKVESIKFIWETIYNKELPEDVKSNYINSLPLQLDKSVLEFLMEEVGCNLEARDDYEETPLLLAIKNGEMGNAEYLISIGADLKPRRFDGKTALHMFCQDKQNLSTKQGESIFESILASSEINAVDSKKRTPLHYAAMKGANDIIKRLAKSGADRNARDIHNATALHYLSGVRDLQWNEEVFEYFVNDFDLDTIDDKGRAPYHIAAQNAPFQFFEELLGRGANINTESDDKGTALHYALAGHRWSNVNLLIELGSNVNTPNKDGKTPLHLGLVLVDILETLLVKGANLHATDQYGQTVLHLASQNISEYYGLNPHEEVSLSPQSEIIAFLIERGCDVNATDKLGRTPLHFAYQLGQVEFVEILLSHGANKNSVDSEGRNILHYAVQSGYMGIEGVFDDSLNVADKNGRRPLFYAHAEDILEFLIKHTNNVTSNDLIGYFPTGNLTLGALKIILEYGVPLNASDEDGNTLLHKLAGTTLSDVVAYLLEKGADVNARNKKLCTPLHIAVSTNEYENIVLLVKKGADIEALNNENKTPFDLQREKEGRDSSAGMVHYLAKVKAGEINFP